MCIYRKKQVNEWENKEQKRKIKKQDKWAAYPEGISRI